MPSAREIAQAIYGAWRLFRFDPRGVELFTDTPEAFWRSFSAALIVAPGYAVIVALQLSEAQVEEGLFEILSIELLSYVVLWTALPVLLYSICRILEREERYLIAVIALNWSVVVQVVITLPLYVVAAEGLLQPGLDNLAVIIVVVLPIVYVWFVAKSALDITGLAAAGIVLVDQVLSVIIRSFTNTLYS